jgi:hypothetical protein
MAIRIVRLGAPREPEEGPRFATLRRPACRPRRTSRSGAIAPMNPTVTARYSDNCWLRRVQLAPRLPSGRVERSAARVATMEGVLSGAMAHVHPDSSPGQLAVRATVHCLTGCGIGEVLGMVMGTRFGWSNATAVIVSTGLAFVFGYALTLVPLRRSGLPWATAVSLALAADTLSITLMEIVDNGVVLVIPRAMAASMESPRFWGSLALSLALAGLAAFPLNKWLILKGRGHAVVHGHHGGTSDAHHH